MEKTDEDGDTVKVSLTNGLDKAGTGPGTPTPTTTTTPRTRAKKSSLTPALDGGWGWVVVAGCCLGHFFLLGTSRSQGVLFVPWMERFGESATATAWAQSLFNTMRMVAGPLVSLASERWGCRIIVLVGGSMMSVGCLAAAFATNIVHLYVSFSVVGGLGGCCLMTTMYIILPQYFDKKKGIAMALATLGTGIGTLALAPLLDWAVTEYSHYGAMFVLSAAALHSLVVGATFRPVDSALNKPRRDEVRAAQALADHGGDSDSEDEDSKRSRKLLAMADETGSVHSLASLGKRTTDSDNNDTAPPSRCDKLKESFVLLKNLSFWNYCVYMWALPCGTILYALFTPGLVEERGYSGAQGAMVIATGGFMGMLGRFLAGFLFDCKLVRKRRWPIHSFYGMAFGVAVFINGLQTHIVGFYTVAVIWGLLEGGFHGQRVTILSEIIDEKDLAKSVGFMIFWQGIGSLMSPTLAGLFRDRYGTFSVGFFYGGSVLTVCSILFFLNYVIVVRMRTRRKSQSKADDTELSPVDL